MRTATFAATGHRVRETQRRPLTNWSLWLCVSVACIAAFATTSVFAAEIEHDMRVTVRVYDNSGYRDVDIQSAVDTATAILRAAEVDVAWHSCDAAFVRTPEHPCAAPLGGNDLGVRLVRMRTALNYRGDLPLGYSLVDARTRGGALATIFMDRVLWLADAAKIEVGPLLGRAMAHEIGHLLLGANAHTDVGLMRAVWSCQSLRLNDPADWMFRADDIQTMKQAIRVRAVPQMAKLSF